MKKKPIRQFRGYKPEYSDEQIAEFHRQKYGVEPKEIIRMSHIVLVPVEPKDKANEQQSAR